MESTLAGAMILEAGTSFLGGIFGMSAQRKSAMATAKSLTAERDYNLGVLSQGKVDKYWSDLMSSWRSGLSTDAGTSTANVIENNQNVLQNQIDFTKGQYNVQIKNAKATADRRFLGVF